MSKKYFASVAQHDADTLGKKNVRSYWPQYAKDIYEKTYEKSFREKVQKDIEQQIIHIREQREVTMPFAEGMRNSRNLLKYLRDEGILGEATKGKVKVEYHEKGAAILSKSGSVVLRVFFKGEKS